MLHAVKVRPVRVRELDADLGCEVIRVVAYRAVCSCSWRSKSLRTVRNARLLGQAHRAAATAGASSA